jgi:hypothetical protein
MKRHILFIDPEVFDRQCLLQLQLLAGLSRIASSESLSSACSRGLP